MSSFGGSQKTLLKQMLKRCFFSPSSTICKALQRERGACRAQGLGAVPQGTSGEGAPGKDGGCGVGALPGGTPPSLTLPWARGQS